MRYLVAFALGVFMYGTPSTAQIFQSCTKAEQDVVSKALAGSKQLALTAAANVYNHDIFEEWFGKYSPQHGEMVRTNLKSVVTAIRTGAVTGICDNVGFDGCEAGTYAWVYPDEPYLIHFCPPFFEMPSMSDYSPGGFKDDNGTREGTVVHEMSHFYATANTDDVCYARDVCSRMAQRRPSDAVINADSYQYFAEDITYFFVDEPGGTVPAASSSAN